MSQFASNRSAMFLIVVWSFLFALFADAANLDDILSSASVLHDDDEVTSTQCQTGPSEAHSAQETNHKVPAPPLRVIIDQDSPSLAAEYDLVAIAVTPGFCDCRVTAVDAGFSSSDLHIKFRTLLI
jgi:hypothetical protein